MIPEDIQFEVARRFPNQEVEKVLKLLIDFGGPRLMRCGIHASKGSLDGLRGALKTCKADARDLIFGAEYDTDEVRKFDFGTPFPSIFEP